MNPPSNTQDHGAAVAAAHGLARSLEWPRVEHEHRVLEPACVACGATTNLQVHHCAPFHYAILLGRPDLELDQRNLITLCEGTEYQCHLLIGHADNFASANLEVRDDAEGRFHEATRAQLLAEEPWKLMVQGRLPEWKHMTDADKTSLRALMDTRFPVAP